MTNFKDLLNRKWVGFALLGWAALALALLITRWGAIHWFALPDTDDNMRMMQVRDLLKGQDWFDLRQYRLNPPEGFNMHWSRLVDLPIAAIIVVARLFVSGPVAERIAIGLAPLLPLIVVAISLSSILRRMVSAYAYLLGLAFLFFAPSVLGMFAPTRIDHHGWQLAMLSLFMLGLVHERRARGGAIAGFALATSFAIGIELLPYVLLSGFILVARWVIDQNEAPRARAFGLALGAGSLIGYFGFASNDNGVPRCDAMTPPWFTTMLVAAIICFLLSQLRNESWRIRLGAATLGGVVIAGFYALVWPQCVGRLEGISPEMQRLWLDNISEARPIYLQTVEVGLNTAFVPLVGLFGHALALWNRRGDKAGLMQWMPLAILAGVSTMLLFFQARVGAAAQILAIPGTVYLAWRLVPRVAASTHMLVRVLGIPAAILTTSGAFGMLAANMVEANKAKTNNIVPEEGKNNAKDGKPKKEKPSRISARCSTLPALKPIALLPRATMFTFVDFGPRLITVTHHNAIAGPYHRNGDAILDVHHVFDGKAEDALPIMQRHGATYLLLCPGMPESTLYAARSPNGFYMQLTKGNVPPWLQPVALPKGSPFWLWRIVPVPKK